MRATAWSFDLSGSRLLYQGTADELRLTDPRLVEYDFELARALTALLQVQAPELQIVFTGDSALRQAHGLVQRLSDDADIRITSPAKLTRGQLRGIRTQLGEALRNAGFPFDPTDKSQLEAENGSRHINFRVAFSPVTAGDPAPHLAIEAEVSRLRLPPVMRPVSSLVARAQHGPPELAGVLCVALEENAAEKTVALLRRISACPPTGPANDADRALVRHIYDLNMLLPVVDQAQVVRLTRDIAEDDRRQRRGQSPLFSADPAAATQAALGALRSAPEWRKAFVDYQRRRVYGPPLDYDRAIEIIAEHAHSIWPPG